MAESGESKFTIFSPFFQRVGGGMGLKHWYCFLLIDIKQILEQYWIKQLFFLSCLIHWLVA